MNQSQQKLTLVLTLVALLVSNVIAYAQANKSGAKPQQPADQAGGLDLEGPANGTTGSTSPAPPAAIDVSDEFQDADADGVRPIPDLDRPAKSAGEQNIIVTASEATRLNELEAKVRRLEQLIEAQSSTLQEIADKIGTPSVELRAIHEELVKLNSKQTVGRPDLGGDPPSLANVGKLVVSNYTGAAYIVSVNGHPVTVAPGRAELNVPFGPVTTEIVGYEVPKTWAETDWRDVDGQRQLAIQIR